MNNNMLIDIGGQKVPVAKVKHCLFAPHSFVPFRSELETAQWAAFKALWEAWDTLDAALVSDWLSPGFTYGSYWVKNQTLNRADYLEYLPGKFKTIRASGSKPKLSMAVLYEGLAPQDFYYALEMTQGEVQTLLIVTFDGSMISSLYMTDPKIFTYERTFAKGGILDENGEPRLFHHSCAATDAGKPMSAEQRVAFAVESVATLLKEADAYVSGVFKSVFKEFPNIITTSGDDTFYHRIDVSIPSKDGSVSSSEIADYVAAAKLHKAWPMIMPVSLFCTETDGLEPICGGSFFLKIHEARLAESATEN